MGSFQENMDEYRQQLARGAIQAAYKGLMDYMQNLKTHLKNKYPDYVVPGSLYFGYMDMTYFSFFPKTLQERDLKIAIVYVHETGRFEDWLAGYNKQVQTRYWELMRASGWDQYRLVPTTKGADAIIEHTLVESPDFNNLDALTEQIERGTLMFIADVERFLAEHSN